MTAKSVQRRRDEQRVGSTHRYGMLDALPQLAFDRLINVAARLFSVPIALISLIDHGRQRFKAHVGMDVQQIDPTLSFCTYAIEQDDVMVVLDARLDARFTHNPLVKDHPGVRFYAGTPLITPDGFKVGTLCIFDTEPREAFTSRDRATLRDLAALVIDELELRSTQESLYEESRQKTLLLEETRRLLNELQDSSKVQAALLGVAELMHQNLPPADIVMRSLELVSRIADVDWCCLIAIRNAEGWVEAVWMRDESGRAATRSLPSKLMSGHGVVWDVLETRRARYATSYQSEERAAPELVAAGLRSAAWLPLGQYDNTSYITLYGRLHQERPWTDRDKQVLEAAATSIRRAMEVREHTRRMQDAALTDSLTHLGNRRAFNEAVQAAPSVTALRVVTVNLNGLQTINDTLGSSAGDALLRVFSTALTEHLPASAKAYRLEGAKFMILASADAAPPALSAEKAQAAQWVAQAVAAARDLGFEQADASCGVGCWPEEALTLHDAIRLAEARLFEQTRRASTAAVLTPQPDAARSAALVATAEVSIGDLTVNLVTRVASVGTRRESLAPKEALLLATLAAAPEQVFTREALQDVIGGPQSEASNALTMHVMHLRRKLAKLTTAVTIRSVRGFGYMLHEQSA